MYVYLEVILFTIMTHSVYFESYSFWSRFPKRDGAEKVFVGISVEPAQGATVNK